MLLVHAIEGRLGGREDCEREGDKIHSGNMLYTTSLAEWKRAKFPTENARNLPWLSAEADSMVSTLSRHFGL